MLSQEKKQKLLEILKIYRSYDINQKARKINDNYNKLLVAAWSSFFLTTHYVITEGKGVNSDLIYYNIESKIKNIFKVRGPPNY